MNVLEIGSKFLCKAAGRLNKINHRKAQKACCYIKATLQNTRGK